MADRFSSAARDRVMSRIKQRDTAPEMALWRALWAAGLRYRLKLKRNRSLSGVLFQPAPTRNNPSHIHQGGAGSDQGDSDQQQVAAA